MKKKKNEIKQISKHFTNRHFRPRKHSHEATRNSQLPRRRLREGVQQKQPPQSTSQMAQRRETTGKENLKLVYF